MMCLGWNTKATCAAATDQQISSSTTPSANLGPGAAAGQTNCPDITWFWIAAAAVVGLSVLKK